MTDNLISSSFTSMSNPISLSEISSPRVGPTCNFSGPYKIQSRGSEVGSNNILLDPNFESVVT